MKAKIILISLLCLGATTHTNIYRFGVSAYNTYGESDKATLTLTTNKTLTYAILAWDRVTNAEGYNFVCSINSTNWFGTNNLGTNLSVRVILRPTNVVTTLSVTGITNWSPLSITNLTGSGMFRSSATLLSGTKYRVTPQMKVDQTWTTLSAWPIFTNSTKPSIRFSISQTNTW